MLKYAIIFALISLVAGALGFSGVAAGAAGIAKVLFVLILNAGTVMSKNFSICVKIPVMTAAVLTT